MLLTGLPNTTWLLNYLDPNNRFPTAHLQTILVGSTYIYVCIFKGVGKQEEGGDRGILVTDRYTHS